MSTYETRLQQRRAGFVERWLIRSAKLQEAVNTVAEYPAQFEVMKLIGKELHQLAGAAGIYELDELCAAAVKADDEMAALIARDAAPGAAELEHVRDLLCTIDTLLQKINADSRTGG